MFGNVIVYDIRVYVARWYFDLAENDRRAFTIMLKLEFLKYCTVLLNKLHWWEYTILYCNDVMHIFLSEQYILMDSLSRDIWTAFLCPMDYECLRQWRTQYRWANVPQNISLYILCYWLQREWMGKRIISNLHALFTDCHVLYPSRLMPIHPILFSSIVKSCFLFSRDFPSSIQFHNFSHSFKYSFHFSTYFPRTYTYLKLPHTLIQLFSPLWHTFAIYWRRCFLRDGSRIRRNVFS